MKSKDLQNDDTPTKIYHHLSGAIGLRTISN